MFIFTELVHIVVVVVLATVQSWPKEDGGVGILCGKIETKCGRKDAIYGLSGRHRLTARNAN